MNVELTQGPIFPPADPFCPASDAGQPAAAALQCGRYSDRRTFCGLRRSGGGGSAYTLMTFLTSVLLGLSMGSGAVFSIRYGEGDQEGLKAGIFHSFLLIGAVAGSDEFHCLPFYRSHYGPSSGFLPMYIPYERVSLDHICRDPGCFFCTIILPPCCGPWEILSRP